MFQFLEMITQYFGNLFNLLDDYSFDFGGVNASLLSILLGFLALSILISVFWKGARG